VEGFFVPAGRPIDPEIQILEVKEGQFKVTVRGRSPLILNRMSEKARHELLMPKGRKTAADKASSLKHNPLEEFRASPYTLRGDDEPTLIALTAVTFKAAMGTAALDLPGARKSEIGRLLFVEGDYVPVFGEPQLLMSIVRSADMNRTPDVRTRCILPEWAATLTITYNMVKLREPNVANLLAAAGVTAGVGDWRPEKGKGSYGRFDVVEKDDPKVLHIQKLWGRKQQQQAMKNPKAYDQETEDLLNWFKAESPKRGFGTEAEAAG
jgi:hypothetical protein